MSAMKRVNPPTNRPNGAELIPMSRETQGRSIKERRLRLGIKTQAAAERATVDLGMRIPEQSWMRAENGTAGPGTFDRIEAFLDRFEERTGHDDHVPGGGETVEFRIQGNFGVDVVVKGPVANMTELQDAVARLVERMGPNGQSE